MQILMAVCFFSVKSDSELIEGANDTITSSSSSFGTL